MKSKVLLSVGLLVLSVGFSSQGIAENSIESPVARGEGEGKCSFEVTAVKCFCEDYFGRFHEISVSSSFGGCGWNPETPEGRKGICSEYQQQNSSRFKECVAT
jgi:hypothetical protein